MQTMITARRALTAILALAAALLTSASAKAAVTRWESLEFHATVTGTSTLHDWTVESRTATGHVELAPAGSGTLRIPAKSLSGGPKGLNEKMYAALKADAHPTIVFEALEARFPDSVSGVFEVLVRGRLTIAGGSRELTVVCRAATLDDGKRVLEAEVPLMMSAFGIKPPTFMGMIRTGDEVKVRVRWVLRPRPDSVARR